MCHIVIYTKV